MISFVQCVLQFIRFNKKF